MICSGLGTRSARRRSLIVLVSRLAALTAILAIGVPAEEATGAVAARGVELVLSPLSASGTDGESDARVARLVALFVPEGEPASPFLEPGPLTATFRGSIALDLNDSFRFGVRGRGSVELLLRGERVLEARALEAASLLWTQREIDLEKGLNELELIYRSPADGDAQLRLYWDNDFQPAEPVPPTVLRHRASVELERGSARRAARELLLESRCLACHRHEAAIAAGVESGTAPRFRGIGSRLRSEWIEKFLLDPATASARTSRQHPRPGPRDVPFLVAYLSGLVEASPVPKSSEPSRGATDQGATDQGGADRDRRVRGGDLYAQLGCAACHAQDGVSAHAGGLDRAASKWTRSGLVQYLLDPSSARPRSLMPRFPLTTPEAEALAAFLLERAGGEQERPQGRDPSGPDIAREPRALGRERSAELGCLACHEPSASSTAAGPPLAELAGRSIPVDGAASREHPGLRIDERELEVFLENDLDSLARAVPVEAAESSIRRLACRACHSRDGEPGRWSTLPTARDLAISAEDSDTLTVDLEPPDLTWAGEKLRGRWLADFIEGESKDRPRPYLRARMPAHPGFGESIARGLAHQHGLALSQAGAQRSEEAAVEEADAELVAIGADLVQGNRLGCHSCHALGDVPALAGAGSQETIDFGLVSRRLRREFFDRFLEDPQRILPGSKMPQFIDEDGMTALYDVFDGDAAKQLDAIWHYLRSLDGPGGISPRPGGARGY